MGRKMMRWARGELLWTVLGFLLIQVILSFFIETQLPRVRDPEFAAKLKLLLARKAEAPDRPLVVALGSSRTLMGLDAGRLSGGEDGCRCLTFNLGLGGCGPMMQRVCLHRLREAGLRPDLILVEVVPFQLLMGSFCPVEDRSLDGARLRSSELAALYPYLADPARQVKAWLLGRSLPCSRHQAELRDWFALDRMPGGEPVGSSPVAIDSFGWGPNLKERTPEEVASGVRYSLGQYRDELSDTRFEPGKLQALRDLLDECRREGIPTAVVLMPEAAPFRALYAAGLNRDLAELLEGLRREYGLRDVIDARTWVGDDGFYDGHHLRGDGACAFTERFGREALGPLLARLTAPFTSRDQQKSPPALLDGRGLCSP